MTSARWRVSNRIFETVLNYWLGFYAVWILHLGRKLGIFQAIAEHGPISIQDLSKKLEFYPPALDSWTSAAISLEFIQQRKGRLALSKQMRSILLDESDPMFIGGAISYSTLRSLEYDNLYALFKSGTTVPPSSKNTIEAFEQATTWDHYAFLETLETRPMAAMKMKLQRGCKLLDVGCGTGKFIQLLSKHYPHSTYVGVDKYLDEILAAKSPVGHESGKSSGGIKHDNVAFLKVSAEDIQFEGEFDIVYFGEVLYYSSDRTRVIHNSFKALTVGGSIVLIEPLLSGKSSSRLKVEDRLLTAMRLDFLLQSPGLMNKRDLRSMLKSAGFGNIKFTNLAASFYMVSARRLH